MDVYLHAESAYELLRDTPGVTLATRRGLPKVAALYGVWNGKELLYVGATYNLNVRWSGHHLWYRLTNKYPEARLSWIKADDLDAARSLETEIIDWVDPPYNVIHVARRTYRGKYSKPIQPALTSI